MNQSSSSRSLGPTDAEGNIIELPPAQTTHWITKRKMAVIEGIRQELISRENALSSYGLSEEELQEWEAAYDRRGRAGLRITKRQRN